MVGNNLLPDERVIYLAFKNVFKGQSAEIRNSKPIRKLIQKHQRQHDIQPLVREYNLDRLCTQIQSLLTEEIFSSTLKAKLRFPELFDQSPAQSAEKEASEAEAAKNEAHAIEQVLQGSRCESGPPEYGKQSGHTDQDNSATLLSGPKSVKTIKAERSESRFIPTLFPIYLPFQVQHKLMVHLQSLLESSCYEFGLRLMPEVFQQHQWDCPESMELNHWVMEVTKRKHIIAKNSQSPSDALLGKISNIRHTAVHRLRVNAKKVQQFFLDAEYLAGLLEDDELQSNVIKLRRDTQTIIEELEQNKNFLRLRLDETLKKIAEQKRALQIMEDNAIAEMNKEDTEYTSFAARTLLHAIGASDEKQRRCRSYSRGSDDVNSGLVRSNSSSSFASAQASHPSKSTLPSQARRLVERACEDDDALCLPFGPPANIDLA